ncbi:MAG: hypothetical protein DRM97_08190 [Thermoprotei archaeon]|nr:MAG: hypothetical protein DRM97_08190 [Thermoprotei archaeon]
MTTTPTDMMIDLLIFMMIVGAASIMLLVSLRRRYALVVFLYSLMMMLTLTTISGIAQLYDLDRVSAMIIGCLVVGILILSIIVKKDDLIARFILGIPVLLSGAYAGVILAYSMPIMTLMAFIIVISLYDVFSVYKGVLNRMLKFIGRPVHREGQGINVLRVAMYYAGVVYVGIGDLIVYSSLLAISQILFRNWILTMLVALAEIMGMCTTYEIALRKGYAPGLIVPVLFSLLVMGVIYFIAPLLGTLFS